MKVEIQEQLHKKYPTLFFVPIFIECGAGWYKILDNLFKKLSKDPTTKIAQVKEKFGGLRVYACSNTQEIFDAIDEAEKKSLKVCEFCGRKGKPQNTSWIKTLCNKCADKHFHKEG